jgi:hypothetical protein
VTAVACRFQSGLSLAVAGCGNATMRLKTGDRLHVDGGRGVVEILEE